MSTAHDLVFGVGHQLDAAGNPIERGIGNLTDRAKKAVAAEVAVVEEHNPVIAEAVAGVEKVVADATTKVAAAAEAVAHPPVPEVATPATPPDAATAPAAPAHKLSLVERLKAELHKLEAGAEAAVEDVEAAIKSETEKL